MRDSRGRSSHGLHRITASGNGVFSADFIERWIARGRTEEREARNRPHPYEIELFHGL